MRFPLYFVLALGVSWAAAQEAKTPGDRSSLPLAPGWWQIDSAMEIPHAPLPSLPKTTRACFTAEKIRSGELRIPLIGDCRLGKSAWQEGQLRLNILCPGMTPPPRSEGELHAAGKTFTGEAQIQTAGEEGLRFGLRFQGQWLQTECLFDPTSQP